MTASGVRHRFQHLFSQETGRPGIVDEQDARDILPRRRGEHLLLHGVVVERHRIDLDVALRFEFGKQGLVAEMGSTGRNVAGRILEGDLLGCTGQDNRRGEKEEGENYREHS